MNLYLKGFVEKCAQYGITKLDQLIKLAEDEPYGRLEQIYHEYAMDENDQRVRLRNTIANLIDMYGEDTATYGLSGAGGVLGSMVGHTLANKDTTSQLLGILGGGAVGSLAGYGGSQLLPDKWEVSLANLIGLPEGSTSPYQRIK